MDALHAVLARAMDAEPATRYPTALAFAAALEAAGAGEVAEPRRRDASAVPSAGCARSAAAAMPAGPP